MNGPPFDIIAYTLLTGLGIVSLVFLAIQTKTWWDGRTDRGAISDRGVAKSQPPAPERQPPAPEQHPPKPESEPSPRRESQERQRLQQLLNRGVELEQNVPGIGGLGAYLSAPATRSEDIDAWEANVEAALRKRPRDVGLFRYEPPRSPLDALATATVFDSPLKRRLRPRLHQLETIINRIP